MLPESLASALRPAGKFIDALTPNWFPKTDSEAFYITLLALVLPVSITISLMFERKNKFPVKGRLVVITGGSQGMGKCVAIELARKGANVAIVARDQKKLDAAVEEVKAAALDIKRQRIGAFSADLSKAEGCKRVIADIMKWHGTAPDIVWACAGGSTPGFFKDTAPEVLEAQMATNYFSVMHTAHAALNAMVDNPAPPNHPKRHLIFTSSVVAFYTFAGYQPYAPAKAAIRSLADGLRNECLLYDIDVSCCFPGTIYTPGYEQENLTKPELTKIMEGSDEGQTPEQVAKVCIERLEKGEQMITTAFLGSAMRAAAWGGSKRNNFILDTLFAWVVNVVWWFVGREMDGHVLKYKKQSGLPQKKD